jgi:hypothetical protein
LHPASALWGFNLIDDTGAVVDSGSGRKPPAATRSWSRTCSGLGCAALEHVRTSAGSKGIGATVFARQADSSGFQMQFAAAAQKIDAAHLRVYLAADDMGEYAPRVRSSTASGEPASADVAAREALLLPGIGNEDHWG